MPDSNMYSALGEDRYFQRVYDDENLPDEQSASKRLTYHAVNQQPGPAKNERSSLNVPWSVMIPLDDWWVLESIALVLSAVILVAISALLQYHDGKPQPNWELVSLNTIVSWLGTLSKSLVLVPVARSLGQLKWAWFAREPRQLSDLQKFDAASRGIWGSLELLFSEKGRYLQSVSCVAMILAIGFGPFLQNLVHYYPRVIQDPSQQAYITKGSHYSAVGLPSGLGFFQIDQVTKAGVYSALFNDKVDRSWETPQYSCNTGSCVFDPVVTLAARARCTAINDHIYKTCEEVCRTTTPPSPCRKECTVKVGRGDRESTGIGYTPGVGGFGLAVNTTLRSLSAAHLDLPVIVSVTVKDAEGLLDAQGYAALNEDAEFVAHECSIELGVQGVQDSVVNSSHIMQEIGFWRYGDPPSNTSTNETLLAWWRDTTAYLALLPGLNHTESPAPGSNCPGLMCHYPLYTPPGFGFDHKVLNALRDFVIYLFNGYCSFMLPSGSDASSSLNYCDGGETRLTTNNYASADTVQAISHGEFAGCHKGRDHLTCGINNVAKALTKTFRDAAFTNVTSDASNLHIGQTLVTVNHVRIDWMWMSMPVLVWTMALLTSIGTAITTRRAKLPAWAIDVLPLLFLYREHEGQHSSVGHGASGKDYLRRAGRIVVELQANRDKAKLM